MAISLVISLIIFVVFHSFLISTGSSTLEFQIYGFSNPYAINMYANWKVVFGERVQTWWLPIHPIRRNGDEDGTQWTLNEHVQMLNHEQHDIQIEDDML